MDIASTTIIREGQSMRNKNRVRPKQEHIQNRVGQPEQSTTEPEQSKTVLDRAAEVPTSFNMAGQRRLEPQKLPQ